ncbi:IclR family transcriptional regulator [Solicola sp. PLA-1-18]|uniref:IclR family transcriptional regulator n=1 Tax=Solicola sp. PLA-1-18 TaxID=3380532 RepID=UPI003B816BE9
MSATDRAVPSAPSMRSLERAIDVLEVLEATRTPLRLSEVARRSGLHISTAQRILRVLEARGRVESGEAGYHTGVAMLFGAHAYLATSRVSLAARPVLQELAATTNLTASVFVRTGLSRAVVARVEGGNPMRYELPIGERLPLHVGAGKVLAAYLDADELATLMSEVDTSVRADGHRIDSSALDDELRLIRERGYAVAVNERVVGAASVSAPVVAADGSCTTAVQVAGHAPDFDDELVERLSVDVRQAASALRSYLPA